MYIKDQSDWNQPPFSYGREGLTGSARRAAASDPDDDRRKGAGFNQTD